MELAGRYRLGHRLGAGTFGEVWKAEDRLHGRPVPIKFLKPEAVASDPVMLNKFEQEARIGVVLEHPGIARVGDFGEYDGRWYLVMEFLHGHTLQDEIDVHPQGLALARLPRLGAQIADALAAAHAHGIVHRDLKPANIMLTGPGQVPKICDFGIAHLAEASTVNTLTGRATGTPAYMAPEQWLGRPVDARTDLYALGGTLYTLATGSRPFKGSLLAVKASHLDTPPIPPRSVRPDLSTGLNDLILHLLAKDPADRPTDAAEVTERLLTPTAASPRSDLPDQGATAPPRTGRPSRRTLLLSLGATAVLAPTTYFLSRSPPGSPQSRPSPSPSRMRPSQIGEPLAGHEGRVGSVVFSPDGTTLASCGVDGTVRLWNMAGRTEIAQLGEPLTGNDKTVDFVVFSPDGAILASGGHDQTIRLWRMRRR